MSFALALPRAAFALAFFVAVGAPVPGHAAWTPLGPEGGFVNVLAVDPATPTTLYAAVGNQGGYSVDGIYKSTDGGTSWQSTNPILEGENVVALAVHPTNHTVLALTDGRLARSTNGGASWTFTGGGFGSELRDLAVDPATPSTLYVATQSNGVFKSTNGGTSFVAQNSGLSSLGVRAIAVAPTSPPTLYVSTFDGVYKSVDGAASWTPSNTGLPATAPGLLAVDPATPTTLVAAGCNTGGVFRSVDGGASWSAANTGLPNATACAWTVAATPTAPTRMLIVLRDAGGPTVFASDDAGLTWTPSAPDLDGRVVSKLAFDPTASSRLYAATYGGFFRSVDGGATWARSMSGIRKLYVNGVTVDPTDTSTMYGLAVADGPSTIVKTTDGGTTWVATGPRDALPAYPFTMELGASRLVVDPASPERLYIATGQGIFRSTDGGASWQLGAGASQLTWDIAIDPFDADTLYSATQGPAVLKSTDAGATWTASNTGISTTFMDHIIADPEHAGVVYATSTFQGIFKTVDHGASWTRLSAGLPAPFTDGYGRIAMDPTNSLHLLVEAGPLRESTDGGASWIARGFQPGFGQVFDPTNPAILYAIDDRTVLKSIDGGATWDSISSGGIISPINGIALDPVTGGTIYAATREGVYKTAPITGACTTAVDCDDLNGCTIDVCNPGAPGADPDTGCVTTPVLCDDQCHDEPGTCNESTGQCQYTTQAFPNGTPCDDGDLCTFDRCLSGVCAGNPVPEPSCAVAEKTSLKIRKRATSDGDRLTWKWTHGAAAFLSPIVGEYALCIYDRSGTDGASVVRLRLVPALGAVNCGNTRCWRTKASGFGYRDRSGAHDGLTGITLVGGNASKARIGVQAAGAALGVPALPLTPRLTVQLRARSGSITRCWGADYEGIQITTNDGTGVKAATR